MRKIRVLVVDDSAFMRKILRHILSQDPQIEVVGVASSGEEALKKIGNIQPDVITLDIEMPGIGGLETLKRIIVENPLPVVVVSAMDKRQADIVMECLEIGAFDFVSKPSGPISLDMAEVAQKLLRTIKTAARVDYTKTLERLALPRQTERVRESDRRALVAPKSRTKRSVVAIAASTGGPSAISSLLIRLPKDYPCSIVIVQHMPPVFTRSFAERLDTECALAVKEGQNRDILEPGVAIVIPGDFHGVVEEDRTIRLFRGLKSTESVLRHDFLFQSVAEVFGPRSVGVILTGMGMDGARGLKAIKDSGGLTIAQDEDTSVVFGMPKSALDIKAVDSTLPLQRIPEVLLEEAGYD